MSGEGNRKEGPKASVSLTCLHPMFLASHHPPTPIQQSPPLGPWQVWWGVCRMGGDLQDPVTQSYRIPSDMQPDPGETLPSGRVPVSILRAGGHRQSVCCESTPHTPPQTQPQSGFPEPQKGGRALWPQGWGAASLLQPESCNCS